MKQVNVADASRARSLKGIRDAFCKVERCDLKVHEVVLGPCAFRAMQKSGEASLEKDGLRLWGARIRLMTDCDARTVRAESAVQFLRVMGRHRCKDKGFLLSDYFSKKAPEIGYTCAGCGFRISIRLDDVQKEKERLNLFWKAIKTEMGRSALGCAASCSLKDA